MKKLLPPLLLLIVVVLMPILGRVIPVVDLPLGAARWGGWLLVLGGLIVSAVARRQFDRIGSNVNTFQEPGQLVTDGLFRFTRNPMYLGFALISIGVACWVESLSALLLALAFVVLTDLWYIRFEERAMDAKFGVAYRSYRRRVRRWI